MTKFFLGFLAAWILFAAIHLIADHYHWTDRDGYHFLVGLPVVVPVLTVYIIGALCYLPWRHIRWPFSSKEVETMERAGLKLFKITEGFYLAYDKIAPPAKRIYFIRKVKTK